VERGNTQPGFAIGSIGVALTFEKRFTLKNYLKTDKTHDMLWWSCIKNDDGRRLNDARRV
jgi:hypothetical protein